MVIKLPEIILVLSGGYAGYFFEGLGKIVRIVKSGFFGYFLNSEVLFVFQKPLGLFYPDFTQVIGKGCVHFPAEQAAAPALLPG